MNISSANEAGRRLLVRCGFVAATLVGVATLGGCGPTTIAKKDAMTTTTNDSSERSHRDKAVALLESLESGAQEPAGYINPNKYIQHNLAVADGLEGFGAVLQNKPEQGFKARVVRAFQDGDIVFTHTEYDFFGPKVGFDVFRFEDGLMVEHWDNLGAITAPNPSGHTQLDGPTGIEDLDKTEANKALVKDFVDTVLVRGDVAQLGRFFDGDNYIQHNSAIGDGLSGLGAALEAMGEQGITMKYDTVHRVVGEGNFVLVVSEGAFADKPTAYYDLFRVENGKVAEHWDVVETILEQSQWANQNGKF